MPTDTELEIVSQDSESALRGGCHEIVFSSDHGNASRLAVMPVQVTYTLPSSARITARAFTLGDGRCKARSYLPEAGTWKWEAKSSDGKGIATGSIQVQQSKLPGKLMISQSDKQQFRTASGDTYLHFGDNAFRYLNEPGDGWQSYIDQATQAGFTKISVWLPSQEEDASNFYDANREQLDLAFWDQAEERLLYALRREPQVQFQLNIFASDRGELERYEEGNPLTHLAVTYALERLGSLPNVHWSLASGIDTAKDSAVTLQALSRLGKAVFEQAPWHSLVTCGQARYANFLFDREKWCGMTSLGSLGQVTGEIAKTHRGLTHKPIVVDQDRAEHAVAPLQPRYYFRRLFWGLLLSGAHPSYEGLDTSGKTRGHKAGIAGYYDACHAGKLHNGAHDLLNIKTFLKETEISLDGWIPDDAIGGGKPLLVKAMRSPSSEQCIVYIANPDSSSEHTGKDGQGFYSDQNAGASDIFTTFNLELPFGNGAARWFQPSSGRWAGEVNITKSSTIFLTPEPGDWVLWVCRS